MQYDLRILKDNKIPTAIEKLSELIDDVYEHMKLKEVDVKFTKKKYLEEYGFNIENKDKSRYVFFGLWFNAWEYNGMPLCITLDWKDNNDSIKNAFIKFTSTERSLISPFELDGFPIASFDIQYIESLNDCEPIIDLLKRLCENLDFGIYFLKLPK